jgi:peptidoglycan/xylan/chitin deacetylase (PgdA/CDA1 family)
MRDHAARRTVLRFALALQALSACAQPDRAEIRDPADDHAPDCEPGSASADIQAADAANIPLRSIADPADPEPLPERVAYLTFDDGPSEWTPDILEILSQQNILATFFITSRQLKGPARLHTRFIDAHGAPRSFQEVLATTLAQGHAIGNHTADHLDLATLDSAAAACQLDTNERAINAALGEEGVAPRPLTLLRPPFGSPWRPQRLLADPAAEQARIGALLAPRGVNVLWNIDSTDSREWAQGESFSSTADPYPPPTAEAPSYDDKVARILASVLQDPRIVRGAGAIIILHDTHNTTRDALPALIAGLRTAGYTFGSVEDLVAARWQAPSAELYPRPALQLSATHD